MDEESGYLQEWIIVKVRQINPDLPDGNLKGRWMVNTPDCKIGDFATREEACKWLAGYFLRHGNGVPVPEATRLLWDKEEKL